MKFVPLEPDPRYGRLARRVALGGVLLLAATTVPLVRLQLGEAGWLVLGEDLGPLLWPLGALGALGAALLLAFVLWLWHRPSWSPLLLLVPCALNLVGLLAGLSRLPSDNTPGAEALAGIASSLAAPAWALALSSAVAAGAALTLGANALTRARTLAVPWGLLLAMLAGLLLVTSFSSWSRLPPRPLTLLVLGAAWLGPLLAAAPWASDAPPDQSSRAGTALPLALLCAVLAGLAAASSDALLLRAAALYAQGPGPEAHAQSLALGGARAPTARLLGGALPILASALVVLLAGHAVRHELLRGNRRAQLGIALSLLMAALCVGAQGLHRHQVRRAVERADRLMAAPATRDRLGPSRDRPEGRDLRAPEPGPRAR